MSSVLIKCLENGTEREKNWKLSFGINCIIEVFLRWKREMYFPFISCSGKPFVFLMHHPDPFIRFGITVANFFRAVRRTVVDIVQIAFGFERPVVVTRVGGLPDVVRDGKTGYIAAPCDPEALAEKITLFFKGKKARSLAAKYFSTSLSGV